MRYSFIVSSNAICFFLYFLKHLIKISQNTILQVKKLGPFFEIKSAYQERNLVTFK